MVLQIALQTIQAKVDGYNVDEVFAANHFHELSVSFNPEAEEYEAYIQGVKYEDGKDGPTITTYNKGTGVSFEDAIISLAAELTSS